MPPLPKISEAEWTVMEALWKRSPQTASEVSKSLRRPTGWALNTVRTLLTRLLEMVDELLIPYPAPAVSQRANPPPGSGK